MQLFDRITANYPMEDFSAVPLPEAIPLHVRPEPPRGRAQRPCFIGDENDRLELFLWLRCLPPDFTARHQVSEKTCFGNRSGGHYDYLLEISFPFSTNGSKRKYNVFNLYFETTFQLFALICPKPAILGLLPLPVALSSKFDYSTCVLFPITECVKDTGAPPSSLSAHPYYSLANFLQSSYLKRRVPESVLFGLTPNARALSSRLAHNKRLRERFTHVVSELVGGPVEVLVSETSGTRMERIGPGSFLYGLTGILPWAIDLLSQRPNCLMTDSTFKCCRPYTLAILHAVFANESIPIAFGLAPTETADSYARIYSHLDAVLRKCPTEIQNGLGEQMRDMSRSAPVPDLEAWPQSETEADDLPTSGVLRGSPRESEDETNPLDIPFDTISDSSSLRSLVPVLANLYLVTDQGTALQSFVKRFNLHWKLCHRHIIESVGASSLIGQWVRRILACYTFSEYEAVHRGILSEMQLLEALYPHRGRAYDTLRRLCGLLEDDHPLSTKAHWALWERLGCPRTTNSAESVNGHLNFDIKSDKDFISRLTCIIKHFHLRYQTRNQWRDRSLERHRATCFPTPEMTKHAWWSDGRRDFERALHNVSDVDVFAKRKFPIEDPNLMLSPEVESKLTTMVPPSSWVEQPPSPTPERKMRRFLELRETSSLTMRDHKAWKIAWSIWEMKGSDWWDKYGTAMYDEIIREADRQQIPDTLERPYDEREAHWFGGCMIALDSLDKRCRGDDGLAADEERTQARMT
jgi:hypothetical protein